jgi:hypothetical protein
LGPYDSVGLIAGNGEYLWTAIGAPRLTNDHVEMRDRRRSWWREFPALARPSFSADGQVAAVESRRTVHILNPIDNGRERLAIQLHEGERAILGLSGKRLLITERTGRDIVASSVFDIASGVRSNSRPFENVIQGRAIAWSEGAGLCVVWAWRDKQAILIDVSSGREVSRVDWGGAYVRDLSPDGRLIVTTGHGHRVRMFKVQ